MWLITSSQALSRMLGDLSFANFQIPTSLSSIFVPSLLLRHVHMSPYEQLEFVYEDRRSLEADYSVLHYERGNPQPHSDTGIKSALNNI